MSSFTISINYEKFIKDVKALIPVMTPDLLKLAPYTDVTTPHFIYGCIIMFLCRGHKGYVEDALEIKEIIKSIELEDEIIDLVNGEIKQNVFG